MFVDTLKKSSSLGDFGCRKTNYRKDLVTYHLESCNPRFDIVSWINDSNGASLSVPQRENALDAVISTDVLHHIKNPCNRLLFIQHIIDTLKVGGKALITIPSFEQTPKKSLRSIGNQDFLVPTDNEKGEIVYLYYHLYSHDEVIAMFAVFQDKICVLSIVAENDKWCVKFIKV